MAARLKIVILGLSITSSWGNGHATTYRSLVAGLARRGHDVLFLEQDQPWYRDHRDLPQPPFCDTGAVWRGRAARHAQAIAAADLVVVGSYVADGRGGVARWCRRGRRASRRSTTSTRRSPWRRWRPGSATT